MIERIAGFNISRKLLFRLGLVALGGVALAIFFSGQGFSYKHLIVGLAALIAAVIVFGGDFGIRFGLVLWVLTLALGYRTVELTENLRLHPSEILIWLLLACILAQRHLTSQSPLSLPWWLWLFIPFWVFAWWPLVAGAAPWDNMLNEFRDFVLLVPLMIVTSVVLQRESYWRPLLLAFFIASTWIAFMGVLEYWFPGIEKLFPAFIHAAKPEVTSEGFMRAQFSFWGGSQATFICALALPSALVLANLRRRWLPRLAIGVAAVVQMLAIYVGGYRSLWFVVLVQVMIACMLRLRKHGVGIAVLCLVVAGGAYPFIPNTDERVMTGIAALQGDPVDHSALARKDRALEALSEVVESPFGGGWSSAGWVHSDFLQVAANLGIIAGLIFLGGYLYTLLRLARHALAHLRTREGDLGLALLLSFVGAGGLLAMQGVEVLPQMVLPVWFVWSLVEVWLHRTSDAKEFCYAPANLYPAANF